MWLYAENKMEQIYAVIMNNVFPRSHKGIMIPQSQTKSKIKTPNLKNFRLGEFV